MPCGSAYVDRPLRTSSGFVASAAGDRWADPKGEFLSALGAEPVYKLFGHHFGATKQPPVDKPVHGRIGYHLRTGKPA